jgi:6-phosphogluconate dehydrogenase (decarboxylating)
MELGFVGLGRMGMNMVIRLLAALRHAFGGHAVRKG